MLSDNITILINWFVIVWKSSEWKVVLGNEILVQVFEKTWIDSNYGVRVGIGEFFIGVGVATGVSWITISVNVNGGVKVSIVISVIGTSSYSSVLVSNNDTVRFRVGVSANNKRLLEYHRLDFRE